MTSMWRQTPTTRVKLVYARDVIMTWAKQVFLWKSRAKHVFAGWLFTVPHYATCRFYGVRGCGEPKTFIRLRSSICILQHALDATLLARSSIFQHLFHITTLISRIWQQFQHWSVHLQMLTMYIHVINCFKNMSNFPSLTPSWPCWW